MKVDHLYVVPIYASLDGTGGDKKIETLRTAQSLYRRHSPKARTAALIAISGLHGGKFDHEILDCSGEDVPFGMGGNPKVASPDSPSSATAETKSDEKKPKESARPTVGMYLVFHSDGGGMVILPADIAAMVAKIVPEPLHAGVTKISLFACDIADRGEGEPIETVVGRNAFELRQGYSGLIGGLAVMVLLLPELADRGIRPMVCGYDIPVFAGDGPYKDGQPSRKLKQYDGVKWNDGPALPDAGTDGRKLTLYRSGRQSLATLKDMEKARLGYGSVHKKVLRLGTDGTIAVALAGWSSKD